MNRPCLEENRLLREESRVLRDKLVTEQSALRFEREQAARLCLASEALRDASRQSSRKTE
jgi:hypothetical protein